MISRSSVPLELESTRPLGSGHYTSGSRWVWFWFIVPESIRFLCRDTWTCYWRFTGCATRIPVAQTTVALHFSMRTRPVCGRASPKESPHWVPKPNQKMAPRNRRNTIPKKHPSVEAFICLARGLSFAAVAPPWLRAVAQAGFPCWRLPHPKEYTDPYAFRAPVRPRANRVPVRGDCAGAPGSQDGVIPLAESCGHFRILHGVLETHFPASTNLADWPSERRSPSPG